MPYAKHNYRVKVPNRSGFDKSHRNSGTLTCGTITPLLCDEVIPGTRASLKLNLATQLPPLVSDTYMNVKLKAEAFFVPMRLCCGSFEDFFCDVPQDYVGAGMARLQSKMLVPHLVVDKDNWTSDSEFAAAFARDFGAGSLMDYLGGYVNPTVNSQIADHALSVNIMPLIAYHLIYQEWYRNPRVQRACFVPSRETNSSQTPVCAMPFEKYLVTGTNTYSYTKAALSLTQAGNLQGLSLLLNDGVSLFSLRQRNFPLDYYTGARLTAQQGDAAAVSVVIPSLQVDGATTEAGSTAFTIAQLRAANSLQQFRERNNIASPRLVDQVKARYGANLSDGVAQRPICIGTASYDIASTGVSQTGGVSEGANPFNSVAAQYGRAYGSGSDFIISDFTANEPGYLMVLVTMVPDVTYSCNFDKKFLRYIGEGSLVDMANPLLQNVGDQPILNKELTGLVMADIGDYVFGYQDRYGDFMFCPNRAHGKFIEGQDLSAFVLQRGLAAFEDIDSGGVVMSSDFLEIPTSYLDGVFAVSEGVSGVSAWYDSYLDYKVSMPLAEFSIPSLQDPAYEHGHSVSLRRNGQIF